MSIRECKEILKIIEFLGRWRKGDLTSLTNVSLYGYIMVWVKSNILFMDSCGFVEWFQVLLNWRMMTSVLLFWQSGIFACVRIRIVYGYTSPVGIMDYGLSLWKLMNFCQFCCFFWNHFLIVSYLWFFSISLFTVANIYSDKFLVSNWLNLTNVLLLSSKAKFSPKV